MTNRAHGVNHGIARDRAFRRAARVALASMLLAGSAASEVRASTERPAAVRAKQTVHVGLGDSCVVQPSCFGPNSVTIATGDTVVFDEYADTVITGPHNVVADDGSFRCARGCDGDGAGGNGSPGATDAQGIPSPLHVALTFRSPGIVNYHCEVHPFETGSIIVQGEATGSGFPVGAGVGGTWYAQGQSGQGFSLQVLTEPAPQLLAYWFVFGPQGGQAWVAALGPIDGDEARMQAYQTSGPGALFPPAFNAAQVQSQPWGTITLRFVDCNHARAEWVSSVPGYGSGGLDLVRLTRPLGLDCPYAAGGNEGAR